MRQEHVELWWFQDRLTSLEHLWVFFSMISLHSCSRKATTLTMEITYIRTQGVQRRKRAPRVDELGWSCCWIVLSSLEADSLSESLATGSGEPWWWCPTGFASNVCSILSRRDAMELWSLHPVQPCTGACVHQSCEIALGGTVQPGRTSSVLQLLLSYRA